MATSNLQDLARQLCDFIGIPVPTLKADSQGVVAFSTQVQGVDITFTHEPKRHGPFAKVYVFFGKVPIDKEPAVQRQLLEANFQLAQPQAPAFSLEPGSGRVVLHYVLALDTATGHELWYGMQPLIDAVLKWRVDYQLEDGVLAPPSDIGSVAASRA